MVDSPSTPPPVSPLEDASHWQDIVESVGVDSMLVVIHDRMGTRLRDTCTAEDIWQQTLLHAWRDRLQFPWTGLTHFRRWLLGIANHRIQDELDRLTALKRRADANARLFSELDHAANGSASQWMIGITTTPDRLAYYKERAQIMRDALATLPEELEVLLRRHLFEGEPIEEIAKSLNIPRATAYSRFRKGSEIYARKLKELLTLSGFATKKRP